MNTPIEITTENAAEVQALVNENLGNGIDNHYSDLNTWSANEIALDLVAYSSDFDHLEDHKVLIPFIKVWQRRERL